MVSGGLGNVTILGKQGVVVPCPRRVSIRTSPPIAPQKDRRTGGDASHILADVDDTHEEGNHRNDAAIGHRIGSGRGNWR